MGATQAAVNDNVDEVFSSTRHLSKTELRYLRRILGGVGPMPKDYEDLLAEVEVLLTEIGCLDALEKMGAA